MHSTTRLRTTLCCTAAFSQMPPSRRRHATRIAGRIIALLFAIPLAACISSPFYYPTKTVYGTPADEGMRYEPVTFSSDDGTRLSGWFIPASGTVDPRQAKGTVIHFHGNAQNMSAHWSFIAWLPQRGFNVFVFDYRGYGQSDGSPEPRGVFQDSNAALDYVRQRPDVDPTRLLVLGQSLGGTNAIAAVGAGNRDGIKAVAIEATFYSYSTIAHDKFPGAGWLVDDTYSADRHIGRIAPIPFLLLHGTADSVIPFHHAEMLLAKASAPKNLVTIEGGGHIEALTPRFGDTYRDSITRFFEAALRETGIAPP